MRVLFVCTGNTCRSCMAEGILKNTLLSDELLKSKIEVSSSGITAYEGEPASQNSVEVLNAWGIDISSHRAKRVTEDEIRNTDLILTMTREHKKYLLSNFPEAKDRIFTLKQYVKEEKSFEGQDASLDIIDPYGMSVEIYRKCAKEIKEAVDKLLLKMDHDLTS